MIRSCRNCYYARKNLATGKIDCQQPGPPQNALVCDDDDWCDAFVPYEIISIPEKKLPERCPTQYGDHY